MSELAREFVAHVHERAADAGGKRECWSYTRGDVTMTLGLGPGVGFAVWTDGDSVITAGGVNTEPVPYETDEWTVEEFPPGCEHPVGVIIDVLERFVEKGDRSSAVEWKSFTASALP